MRKWNRRKKVSKATVAELIREIGEARGELTDFFDTLDPHEPEDQRDIRKLRKVDRVLVRLNRYLVKLQK